MSVRHFNYTERKRILRSDVSITLVTDATGTPGFDVNLNLEGYQLPSSARVLIEAYRQASLRRYDFGTVGERLTSAPSTDLEGLPEPASLLFRVKVVDVADRAGRLLAEADRVRPTDPDDGDRPSLLSVRESDLSGELWQLSYPDGEPVLLVERQHGPHEALLVTPHFRWMVLPEVLRQLLREALVRTGDSDDDEEDEWPSKVIRQGERLVGEEPPSFDDAEADNEEWITSAVRAFCRRHSFAQRYAASVFPGAES